MERLREDEHMFSNRMIKAFVTIFLVSIIIPTSVLARATPCTNITLGEKLTVSLLTPLDGATRSSSEVELRAEVTRAVLPVSGATVKFYVDDAYVGQSTTGVSGYASYTRSFSEGTHTWYVTAEKEGYESDTSPIRTITIELPFDFRISVSPSSQTVTKGASTTYTVTVSLVGGSPENVILTVVGLPSATKSFSVSSGTPSFTFILTVDTNSLTLTGSHTLTITGTSISGLKTYSTSVEINVEEPSEFDFSISVSPSSQTVTKGGSTNYIVTVTLLSGSPETVWLSVTGVPSATKSFGVSLGSPAFTSTLTVDTTIATPEGTHTLTIRGVNDDESVIREDSVEIKVVESITSVLPSLTRTPEEVKALQPALIFAHVQGSFSTIELSTTITINLFRDGSSVTSFPHTISEKKLPLVPILQSPGWYFVAIPGLPAKTIDGVRSTWKVESSVYYKLLIDGVEVASDSYIVKEGEAERRLNPLIMATVYDVIHDREILNETYGLGPRGWKTDAVTPQKMLIVAVDDKEIENVDFEYSVSDGNWKSLTVTRDTLMNILGDLITDLDKKIELINKFPQFPELEVLPRIRESIKIYSTEVPGQAAGNYVKFRANATDNDGNSASSPIGFYFVVNEDSDTRILIIDPHIKLWLLEENLEKLVDSLKSNSDYQVPSSIIGNMTLVIKIADIMENCDIVPFHHWETLGKHYNLTITWPDEEIVDLLKRFRPDVIMLSNLRLGIEEDKTGYLDWDLEDLNILQDIIQYVKENHAGVIATHGTMSDWKVWIGPKTQYKVAARGHVGETITDIDPINEKTLAALLGLPELALWEYARDSFATALGEPFGPVVGSLPLQVPRVPFDEPMKITVEGWDHPILEGIPQEFEIITPSIYDEFGFKSFTQVGWQLALPRSLAYRAWLKSNETSSTASKIIEKMGDLVENATAGTIQSDEASRIHDSLEWGLRGLYRSLISANITDGTFTMTLNFPSLDEPVTLTVDVDYQKLLQSLPVKIIALSGNGLAGIITHDKYWDPDGYRAVYFTFEPEASNSETVETLLKNSIDWSSNWNYKPITELLGDKVRVLSELADRFEEITANLPGNVSYSGGVILNEEGYATIEVDVSQPTTLHIAVAHPSSDKVKVIVLEGEAKVTANVTFEQTTNVTVYVQGAGSVKLGLSADSESSLNPAYVIVKQEPIGEEVSDNTPPSISDVSHQPSSPESDEEVTVTTIVIDDALGVEKATLYYRLDGGSWASETMTKTDNVWSATLPAQQSGVVVEYYVEAFDKAGNTEKSTIFHYTVRKTPSSITCSISAKEVQIGESITVSGSIDTALMDAPVTLTFTKPDGSTATGTVRTASDGSYTYPFEPEKVGDWSVKASWPGDAAHEGAVSSKVSFKVAKEEAPPEKKCIIATTTYGSELAPEVQFLRGFRDNIVLSTFAGSQFMTVFNAWYYSFSPNVAGFIADHPVIKTLMKGLLYPLIGILKLSASTHPIFGFNPELAVVMAGFVASSMIGVVYFSPLTMILLVLVRRLRRAFVKTSSLRWLAVFWMTNMSLLFLGEISAWAIVMKAATAMFVVTTLFISAMITVISAMRKLSVFLRARG